MNTITMHTRNTTYQIGIMEHGFLLHLYYGPRTEGSMDCLLSYYDRGFSGNPYEVRERREISMDYLPQEYSCFGNGDFRSPAFQMRDENGVFGVDLRCKSRKRYEGKYVIQGLPAVYAAKEEAYTEEVLLEDKASGVEVTLRYGVLPELDVITRSVEVRNNGSRKVFLNKVCSASMDFLTGDFDLLHFYGRHTMERNVERIPVVHGNQGFGSRRGTSSHQHNPFVILADRETTEDHGSCWGMSLLYSGNFWCETEKDQYDQTRLQIGILPEMFDYPLAPGEVFLSPEAVMAYTEQGLSALSHIYHELIRRHVCRGRFRDVRRPVLINNWEATYFTFTGEQILNIAEQASELGVEMFVLDDGWFGKRDNDDSGLGDWVVNEKKIGMTLGELSEKIHGMGMQFGLWIEPEMVNEDSELYRLHPDWAFVIPGRKPIMGRNQLTLDFSRREVVDYIFEKISGILEKARIEYIKMDMNRSINDVYTAAEGFQNYGEIMHRYVLGVYDFLERLTQRFPGLLIEGCSGGGGRFDAGMLYYTPQIWCSDDTDAIERIHIQHGTSFGYPISAVGSHVSAVPNHQTGRTVSLNTRAAVAMAGSFGYELDLNTLSEEEKEEVKRQIEAYKENWEIIHEGLYYRLTDPSKDPDAAAWSFVSRDGSEMFLNIVSMDVHSNAPVPYVRCRGLMPDRLYKVKETGRIYSGGALMSVGFPVPVSMGEYNAWQYHFQLCK
ncbi:MAG TPA: alpha-galactosidase [Candidatus Blautia faecipullorum]|nr:alpha-galactosidase [Candidatus Blautia faecipullorum]